MEIEDGVEHDNIEAHILARKTAEQERKTRWVRCALALLVGGCLVGEMVGVSVSCEFPQSPTRRGMCMLYKWLDLGRKDGVFMF